MEEGEGYNFLHMTADDAAQITLLKSRYNRMVVSVNRQVYQGVEGKETLLIEMKKIRDLIERSGKYE